MNLIRKQRIKYIVSSTICAALFLLFVFGAFFGLVCLSRNTISQTVLDRGLTTFVRGDASFESDRQTCIFIIKDNDRLLSFGDMSEYQNLKNDILSTAWDLQKGRFHLGDYYFACDSKELDNGETVVAIFDRSSGHKIIVDTLLQLVLTYCLSVVVAFLLSFLSSARLLQPVSEAFSKQRDLIANASHELKTPLTVIATNLNVIQSEPNSTIEENAQWLNSVNSQVKRMQGLVQNMLTLSKMETAPIIKEEMDLSLVIEGACLAFEPICFEKNVNLVSDVKPNIKILGDKAAMERLAAILLDNAVKYCGKNGKVGVRLSLEQKRILLTVMNTGESITKEEAKHVFDRFYRTDGARKNEDSNSFGLGLAIAAATVEAHGGSISCHGVEDKGTVFNVALPLIKNKKQRTVEKE